MASTVAFLRLGGSPVLRARPTRGSSLPRRYSVEISSPDGQQPQEAAVAPGEGVIKAVSGGGVVGLSAPSMPAPQEKSWEDHPDYRRWKDKEDEILRDIEPIMFLTKDILHSDRYGDGETLNSEDEREVVEKLLAYHPHSDDKVGCGIDSIMVDRHPRFRNSRCLFVVRIDGVWIDFSYQKCLRAYIRDKYPSYAERFIFEHFRRT
ncbi:Protein DCL, chloroplastic [Apostasia shenzhenica]|uniref:Protein DCL, chloroplastic n=1 Tax=Apostasia shenzhenica TaxID=1088818 RepID=A0A2I0A2X4_9ASPA|nr:Protein DCL, chloroplastic [Apostasia shenzhenica]